MHYARVAHDFIKGIWDTGDHFTFRWTITGLAALSYSILGVNDMASALPALIVASLTLLLVIFAMRHYNLRIIIIVLALVAFNRWWLYYTDKLMPDIFVALAAFLALLVIGHYKYRRNNSNTATYAFFLAGALFFGFLSKGSIVLIVPLMLYLFVVDIFRVKHMRFWLFSGGFLLLLFTAYFGIIEVITGEALQRFHSISQNHYLNLCSYDKEPVIHVLRRISYQFFELMLHESMLTGTILALAGLIGRGFKKRILFTNEYDYWLIATLVLFISANFMTISVSGYVPMCLDPRHYLFLIPVSAVSGSLVIQKFMEKKHHKLQLNILLLSGAIAAYFAEAIDFFNLYVPLAVTFLAFTFIPLKHVWKKNIFTGIFVLTMLTVPAKLFRYGISSDYKGQRHFVYENIINSDLKGIVISNEVQKRICEYYNEFRENQKKFVSYSNLDTTTIDTSRNWWLLRNVHTRILNQRRINELPFIARHIDSTYHITAEDDALGIRLYKLTRKGRLHPLVKSTNHFEKAKLPNWNTKPWQRTSDRVLSGEKAAKSGKYSDTFELSMDRILDSKSRIVVIKSSIHFSVDRETKGAVVISLQSKGKNYKWYSLGLDEYVKAYGNHWWEASKEIYLYRDEIKPSTKLQIYVWNREEEIIYLDDFSVDIQGLY